MLRSATNFANGDQQRLMAMPGSERPHHPRNANPGSLTKNDSRKWYLPLWLSALRRIKATNQTTVMIKPPERTSYHL
jgi:hypothetical protein